MAKQTKKPQVNIKKSEKSKETKFQYNSDSLFTWREIPIMPVMVKQWAQELEAWVQDNPEAKTLTEFIYAKNLDFKTYHTLKDRHPELQAAHERAKRRLGERLWAACVDRKADWSAVRFMLHHYGPEFDDAKKYDAAIKEKIAAAGGIKIVEIPAFGEVAKKKEKK